MATQESVDAVSGVKRNMDAESSLVAVTKRYRPQDTSLRLLISSRAAGSVIGKGGQNINRLREQYSASINIPDTLGTERVVNISADRESAIKVVEELLPNLDDAPGRDPDSADGEMRVLVHTSQAGCIIGRSGFKIKELREGTGCTIKVYTEPCPQSSDRVCQVQGQRHAVMDCLRRVMTLLDENPPTGVATPYDPMNADEIYASEYGGYPGGGRAVAGAPPPAGMGRGAAQFAAARQVGYAAVQGVMANVAARGGFTQPAMAAAVSAPAPAYPGTTVAGMGYGVAGQVQQLPPGGMDFGQPASLQAGNGNPQGELQTQQFSVPKAAAGAIIGKGGSRIRKVRGDSGAQINIDDTKDGQVERIVTISGTAEQVQMAHFLLQKCVRENSEGQY